MIVLGCDHGGINLKTEIIKYLTENNIEFEDYGCYSTESVDYPEFAFKVANAVASKKAEKGILCCGTGIGISIAANKVKGIRAAVCTNEFMAEMTRRHNNANIICMGGRIITPEKSVELVKIFLNTEFEGGRHEKRVNMISDIENNIFEK